jgi:ribonuclease BN (tRNA processing enzyme)
LETGLGFDLTVLGSAGTHTGPARACSGYLYQTPSTRVLVDCGNGASSHLLTRCDWSDLDAVVVTHRHVDHCADLIGAFYAMKFHADGPQSVDFYAPAGVLEVLLGMLNRDSAFEFTEVFRHVELGFGDRFSVGDMSFECFESIHPAPTVTLRTTVDGRVLTYSSDSAGGDVLEEAARGADLFMCEATWQGDASAWPVDIHLTARDAGALATRADAPRLLLTHILGSLDRGRSVVEARETYDGDLGLAEDGVTFEV